MTVVAVDQEQVTEVGLADTHSVFQHGLEYRFMLAGRRADNAQHICCGLLSLQRLITLAAKARGLTLRAHGWRTAALWRRRLAVRALASLLLALERRRIAFPKAQDKAL